MIKRLFKCAIYTGDFHLENDSSGSCCFRPNVDHIPRGETGVYLIYAENPDEVLYIGKAKSMKGRVTDYWYRPYKDKYLDHSNDLARRFYLHYYLKGRTPKYMMILSNNRENYERSLIKKIRPLYNTVDNCDTSHPMQSILDKQGEDFRKMFAGGVLEEERIQMQKEFYELRKKLHF